MASIKRQKHEIDAAGNSAGRIATRVAMILRGKNKAGFVPRLDSGDYVTVINASKIKFTGRKLAQKDYHHHTMHPGGLKSISLKRVFEKEPAQIIRKAVYGMLPKNKLRVEMMKRLIIKA